MSTPEIIAKRKSVRAYTDEPVSPEMVEQIVEAGRWAPNHGEYHMSVIRNPELKQRISDLTLQAMKASGIEFLEQRAALPGYQPLYGAPVAVLLSGPADAPASAVNCALAAENMLLEATSLGLGSCFIMSARMVLAGEAGAVLAKEAGIPEGYAFQCGVLLGYAAAENKFSPAPEDRVPRGTVTYLD